MANQQKDNYARITFRVVTADPLPVGEQVFLSGSLAEFGNWRADGLPLTRVDDRVWSATVDVEKGLLLEFKITRGSWQTEAWDEPVPQPPNLRLMVKDDREVECQVGRWKDQREDADA